MWLARPKVFGLPMAKNRRFGRLRVVRGRPRSVTHQSPHLFGGQAPLVTNVVHKWVRSS